MLGRGEDQAAARTLDIDYLWWGCNWLVVETVELVCSCQLLEVMKKQVESVTHSGLSSLLTPHSSLLTPMDLSNFLLCS